MSKCNITNSGKIESYLLNQLSNDDEKDILIHLLNCNECETKVSKLRKVSNTITSQPQKKKPNRIWWIMAAASIVVILGVVGYFYINNDKKDSIIGIADNDSLPVSEQINIQENLNIKDELAEQKSIPAIEDNESLKEQATEIYFEEMPDYAEAEFFIEEESVGFKLISPKSSELNYSYVSSEDAESVITFKWKGVNNNVAVLILGNNDEIIDKFTVFKSDSIVVDISKYQQLEYIDWVLMVNDVDNMHEGKIIILK